MATKGGADATLVAAAYRLGQSFKPGDYTEIFKHQYKGLTEAYKAKYKAIGDVTTKVAEEAGEIATTIAETTEREQEELDALDIDNFIDTMAEDLTEASIQDNNEHYSQNKPLHPDHFSIAEAPFLGWKEELQTFVDKPFLSKEEKKRQSEILRKVQQHKDNLNKNKSDYIALSNGISEGHVNMQQSFKGDPMRAEKLELTRILMDPNADFDKYGIKMEWKDGKKHITYSPGLLGITNSLVSDSPIITPPGSKSLTITEDELFKGFKYKDKKSIVDHNAQLTEGKEAASLYLDDTDTYAHKDFNAIAGSVYIRHKDIAMASPNFNDITTREVEVGGTMRTYEKDLPMNIEIDEAVINQMGIGSDVFTKEELADGKIDAAELEKHLDAKGVIMEKLLNPKTPSEKEIAAGEYGKWWTRHTKTAFDNRRTALDAAKKVKDGVITDDGGDFTLLRNNKSSEVTGKGGGYTPNKALNYIGKSANDRTDIDLGADKFIWDKDKNAYTLDGEVVNNKYSLFSTIYGENFDPVNIISMYNGIEDWKGETRQEETFDTKTNLDISFVDKADQDVASDLNDLIPPLGDTRNPNNYSFEATAAFEQMVRIKDESGKTIKFPKIYPKGHPKAGEKHPKADRQAWFRSRGNTTQNTKYLADMIDLLQTFGLYEYIPKQLP